MLERIPVQSQTASLNPIADAVSWNIPVYSIEFFQKWLDKKLSQIQVANEKNDSKNEANARTFEKKYLKLESVLVNQYRPEFKEVSKWPSIDINTLAGSYPFDTKLFKKSEKKENADKKKEGERMNRTCNKTANEAGYCEICAVHYSDLSQHVASSTHAKFICNDKNYADIDNCIKTRSVEAFLAAHNSGGGNSSPKDTNSNEPMGRNLRKSVSLHLNNNENSTAVTRSLTNAKLLADESLKQPLQVQCNGFTNYHLRKASTKSDSAIIKSPNYYGSKDLLRESRKSYASCPDGAAVPAGKEPHNQHSSAIKEENVHRLRSRKSLFLPSILLGTTAEDGPNKIRSGISPQTPTSNHFLRSSVSPRSFQNNCGTRSRLPGVANAAEEDGRKGSVGSPGSMRCIDQANASSIYFTRSKLGGASPNDTDGKRHSRGSVSPRDDNRGAGANGRKRKLSTATSDDEEGGSASASPRNLLSYHTNRKMMKNNASCNDAAQLNNQKKRLSVEEKFLVDNREYYKVEMLRTKLRSTEFYCNQEINQTVPDTFDDRDPRMESLEGGGDNANGPEAVADGDIDEQTENGDAVVMRFKKIKQRKSALSLLNLEAENFLFGPPKKNDTDDESDSSQEENDDDDDEMLNNGVEKRNNDDDRKTPNAKHPNAGGARRTKTKKRRTHAEVFIHDNLDYYRFEISGSRLRHQNADGTESTAASSSVVKNEPNDKTTDAAPIPSSSTSAVRIIKVKEETVTDEENDSKLPPKKRGKSRRKDTTEMDKEAENVKPQLPTDSTPAKTEESEDGSVPIKNTCCVRTPPVDSLHFSFESVPAKEPWYKTFVRYDTCNEYYIPIPNTTISRFQKITNTRNASAKNSAASAAAAAAAAAAANELNLSPLQRRKRRSKLARIIAESKPRKSPRCHASTLAILSSLTNHRRRSRKIHAAVETRRGPSEGRASLSRSETGGNAASSGAGMKAALALSQANSALEFEARLKEAINTLAKDVDEHFIELFSNEDCRDKYLNLVNCKKDQKIEADPHPTNDANADSAHCCMQLDESIFLDQEFLDCYIDGTSDAIVDDMATFMNDAQRCCNSMETAIDEECAIPRSNDLLSRLCRENDNSCNSSDCGASSTCEFLGFAEDGRTVSRKRKRKRPNMTGWPHSNRRRRHIRFTDIVQRDANESPSRQPDTASVDTGTDNENVSEADSECTDDDMPLSEIVSRKRRRGASLSSAGDAASSSASKEQPRDSTNDRVASRVSSRRSSKSSVHSPTLPYRRRGKRGRRRV
ncbi:uncharacterized protein LOC135840572 isoform X2 [Planococcus citri]